MDEEIRVLHVDDDPEFVDLTATHLEEEEDRIHVLTAPGPREGLELLSEYDIDCVVSNDDLPRANWIELLESVREEYPELPFILFAGQRSADVPAKAIEEGVTSYLHKEETPAQYAVLRNRIRTHVEQYRTKHRVARIKQEYKLVAEAGTDAFWMLDVESGQIQIDGLGNFGYDDYEQTREWWIERIHPEDRQRVLEHDENVLADRQVEFDEREDDRGWFTVEYRWRRADGTFADCIERGVVVFDDEEPVKMVGTIEDVTERKQRERKLRETSARLEALFERSPDMINVHDHEGNIIEPNARLCAKTGYDREELTEMKVWDIDEKTDPEKARRAWAGMEYGDRKRLEGAFRRRDGSTFPVEVHLRRLDLDGEDRFVVISRDVSERKNREERLKRQNKRLEEFASVVSHDLRNPLNVARLRVELAREECDRQHLDAIEDAHERMSTLMEDLLSLALEGEAVTEHERIDLAAIVEEGWRNVETGSASVVTESDRTVSANRSRLKQLFENLFHNAVEHGPEGVTVRVGDLEDGFFVEDDGPGIPEEERDEAFETGYSTDGNGTGFGLSIVGRIVEAHGWEIRVVESSDGGARFEITGVEE